MNDNMFSSIDFGPVQELLENDDVTDISYSNGGQCWLKTLSKGIYRIENPAINNSFMEKLAFQCANAMGKSFNMAYPFLDAEGAELRLNFVHDSIAKNGIACVMRKTPAKIRLEKDKLLKEKYIDLDILDFLVKCVHGHCNIIVCGETGSGKTEFVKYLASQTRENEKLITIEDTLELHLDRIYPTRDIVSMKTNNIASYSDVLVTCMRQNPKWILLSEVRSAEAVMAVRNSISSGHYILSTIHADKASSIPNRMYSLLETNQDIEQFLKSIYRYIQIGIYIRGFQDRETKRFVREIAEVTEFYVTEDNEAVYNIIYQKSTSQKVIRNKPSKYLVAYLDGQGVILDPDEVKTEEELKNELAGIDFDSFVEKTKQIENGQVPGIKTSDEVANIPVKNDVPATPAPQIPQAPMEPQIQPAVVEAQIKPTVVEPQIQPTVVEPQVQPAAPQIPQPVAPQIPQQPMQPSAPVAPQSAPLNPGVETLDF
jgi:pilus assembly protein CpaF